MGVACLTGYLSHIHSKFCVVISGKNSHQSSCPLSSHGAEWIEVGNFYPVSDFSMTAFSDLVGSIDDADIIPSCIPIGQAFLLVCFGVTSAAVVPTSSRTMYTPLPVEVSFLCAVHAPVSAFDISEEMPRAQGLLSHGSLPFCSYLADGGRMLLVPVPFSSDIQHAHISRDG